MYNSGRFPPLQQTRLPATQNPLIQHINLYGPRDPVPESITELRNTYYLRYRLATGQPPCFDTTAPCENQYLYHYDQAKMVPPSPLKSSNGPQEYKFQIYIAMVYIISLWVLFKVCSTLSLLTWMIVGIVAYRLGFCSCRCCCLCRSWRFWRKRQGKRWSDTVLGVSDEDRRYGNNGWALE